VKGELEEAETLYFFKTLVFNKLVPLETLEITNTIVPKNSEDICQLLTDYIVYQDYQCPLKDFTVKTKDTAEVILLL
jgi:hypothetical protein